MVELLVALVLVSLPRREFLVAMVPLSLPRREFVVAVVPLSLPRRTEEWDCHLTLSQRQKCIFLPSLTPLSVAGCGRLQLGAPHWATSVNYCK